MRNFITFLFYIINRLFSYKLLKRIYFVYSKIYSEWLRHEFRSCGMSVQLSLDFELIGGDLVSIGNNCYIGKHAIITAWKKYSESIPESGILISIGNGANIGEYVHITAVNGIHIGENVLMGKRVTISDNNHGDVTICDLIQPPLKRKIVSKGKVFIGKNVWIGDKATILGGVSIGDGAIIGANTVVTKNVPAFSVCVGSPCRIIKHE